MKNKIFIFDGTMLLYRAYYTFIKKPIINTNGFNISVIFGFINSLIHIVNKNNPTHLIIIFDSGNNNIRKNIYKYYKSNRKIIPNDIVTSLPIICDIIKYFNIQSFFSNEYEADDLIGSIALYLESNYYNIYIVTNDKDMDQLSSKNTYIYNLKSQVRNYQQIINKWNIKSPKQIPDILGLAGDKIDNIPGVPGIGIITAQNIIKNYGSIENALCDNEIKIKGQDKLLKHHKLALISKKLATIFTDIKINIKLDKLKIKKFDLHIIRNILKNINHNQYETYFKFYSHIF